MKQIEPRRWSLVNTSSDIFYLIASTMVVIVFILLTLFAGKYTNTVMLAGLVLPIVCVVWLIRTGRPRLGMYVFAGSFVVYQSVLLYLHRHEESLGIFWFVALPVVASTVGKGRDVLIWTALSVAAILPAWHYQAHTPAFAHPLSLPNLIGATCLLGIVCYRFVRDRSRREVELLRLAAQAREAEQRTTRFLASMSHELRMPMTSMLLSAELLQESELVPEGEASASVDRIVENTRITMDLLNDVLDLAKFTAGKLALQWEAVALEPLLEDIRRLMEPQAQANGCRLAVLAGPAAPAYWYGDAALMRQILVNLVSNAIKHTNGGSVTLEMELLSGWLRLLVVDTGTGIEVARQGEVFEPFTQLGDVTQPGTGLGLTLCREYAEALGGTLELLESMPGQGSTFLCALPWVSEHGTDLGATLAQQQSSAVLSRDTWLVEGGDKAVQAWARAWLAAWGGREAPGGRVVPLARLYPRSVGQLGVLRAFVTGDISAGISGDISGGNAQPALTASPAVPASHAPASHRGTCLICDDSDMIRDVLKAVMVKIGYSVGAVATGAEALAYLDAHPVDFLFLDVQLGEESGISLLRQLRTPGSAHSDLPICMISGNTLVRDEALAAGADAFLIKPPRLRDITQAAAMLSERRRLAREEAAEPA